MDFYHHASSPRRVIPTVVSISRGVPRGASVYNDDDNDDWRVHSLKFAKNDGQSTAASQYLASADDYEVLDPREPLTGEIGMNQAKNGNRQNRHYVPTM